jgi:cytochrome c oxidase assembly protein subunit 15
MVHRWFAVVVVGVLLWLGARLIRADGPSWRGTGFVLVALALAQVFTGLSNVVLGWPIAAALAHAAGAAALVAVLTLLLARSSPQLASQPRFRAAAPVHGSA